MDGAVREVRERVAAQVVGREHELDLLLAAVAAGRDVLMEGPPGTSKSTLLRALTREWGIGLHFLVGNGDLTPSRLVGHHNPSRVLREDYSADNFVAGPLVAAMQDGGFLYLEEFNRAPEDTVNTLLTAMAERSIAIPRVGTIDAHPSFRVIASMNPYDNVGTTRLSTSVYDRLCRIAIGYQDAAEERRIVTRRTTIESVRVVADAVALTRATRERDDIWQGSSVRGAIDLALLAEQLAQIRGVELPQDDSIQLSRGLPEPYTALMVNAMLVALSGRIHLDEPLRIARRLAVTRPRRDVRPQRGAGELVSTRWRGASDDIDLDATIAVLAENPAPEDEDIVVRERVRRRRSVALVVDVSGSMRGERVRTAAATVGALASELARERLAVVAFWSDAAVLSGLDETVAPNTVLDLLLRIPARGSPTSASGWNWRAGSCRACRRTGPGSCCCRTACTMPARIRG